MCEKCDQFVHLHVHSEYSLLDGLSRIDSLAQRAVELQQPALALTDHGAMYGTIDFYRACKNAGVKPIIGIESYVAARTMADRDPQLDRNRFHLLLLAKDKTGYLNLLKTASEAQLSGYYYRPRVDHDFMAAHADGLIATSGCMAAEIPRALGNGQIKKADELMGFYLDTYGKDNFFIELQEHDIPALSRINQQLIDMANRFGMQNNFLVTNDVHYTTAEEANPHEVLLCIQTSSTVKEPKLKLSNKEYYLKSAEQMAHLFRDYPHDVVVNAFENSLRITEMCDVDLDSEGYHLPIFDVPPGYDAPGYLRELCESGLTWRYGAERAAHDENLRRRLDHELNIIHSMGFDTYFLIVWDLCEFARRSREWWAQFGATFYPGQTYEQWAETDIWWNVRGSGAGSVVAYTLGITGIDPIANGLIFERFLNPGRVSMPDIDLDYPDDRRHEMVEYTMRRYGAEKVAQIITFGTMKARAAVRDVGRAMDISLERVDQIARMIPAIPGKKVKIADLFEKDHEFYTPDFVAVYDSDPQARTLIDTAQQLEGVSRHASSHAAGVIIADKPLVEYVPLNRPTSGDTGLGGIDRVTQWPMEVVESIGLLKVDFLGLSTLTVLRTAARIIEERYGVKYEMDNIPYDVGHVGPDPSKRPEALFEMLARGDVGGVFQVEGPGMRRLMMDMKPSRFDHIIAAISLYRPGPMENIPEYIRRMHADIFENRDIVEYHTPALEPILQDTYGIIVYQEQIIRIAAELAGYAPGDADMIRKAVSKKKEKLMEEHRKKFTAGAMARGHTREECEAIWGDIEFFARYGFNKAHAADYAVITCQTAFLKAHYPVEYMAALLSVEREKTEKVTKYLAESRRLNIEVAPPDINSARIRFTIEDTDHGAIIRYGLGAIKNAGEAALSLIADARDADGAFRDVQDLCERVDLRRVGSRAMESMIKVGVFDKWGTRPQFLDATKRIISYSGTHHDERNSAQMSLFGMFAQPQQAAKPDLLHPKDKVPAIDHRTLLDWEKELLGVYLSEHPLQRALALFEDRVNATSGTLDAATSGGKQVVLGGMIASLRPYTTKKGDPMAFGQLEDLEGKVDLVFFPRTWKELREQVNVDQICLVKGKVNVKDDSVSVIVDAVWTTLQVASVVEGDSAESTTYTPRLDQYQIAESAEAELSPASWEITDDDPDDPPKESAMPQPAPTNATPTTDDVPQEPDFGDFWPEGAQPAQPPTPQPAPQSAQQPAPAANGSAATNGHRGERVNNGNSASRTVVVEIKAVNGSNWRDTCRSTITVAERFRGLDILTLRLLGQPWTIDLPNQPTRFCDELAMALEKVPGVKRVYAK